MRCKITVIIGDGVSYKSSLFLHGTFILAIVKMCQRFIGEIGGTILAQYWYDIGMIYMHEYNSIIHYDRDSTGVLFSCN